MLGSAAERGKEAAEVLGTAKVPHVIHDHLAPVGPESGAVRLTGLPHGASGGQMTRAEAAYELEAWHMKAWHTSSRGLVHVRAVKLFARVEPTPP